MRTKTSIGFKRKSTYLKWRPTTRFLSVFILVSRSIIDFNIYRGILLQRVFRVWSKLSRIGKQNANGKPRLLQVVCASNEIREEIIKAAPKLKEKGGDLAKIFLKGKDQ